MSASPDISISFSSIELSPNTRLNDTSDIIGFYSRNNVTLNTLVETYALTGKEKSKYFVKKDIALHSKFAFNLYINCHKCKVYRCFENNDRKKICYQCLSNLKPVETNFFVYIPVRDQIRNSIKRNFANIVNYHEEIIKRNSENLYDIHSGSVYQNILGVINRNNNDANEIIPLSYMLNIDGIEVFKLGSDSLWPIQLVQNGLPPKLRYLQENIIIAGLFYGRSGKLPIHSFFNPLCNEFMDISTGLKIKDRTFMPIITHTSLDLPARSKVQCFNGHMSRFACNECFIEGTPIMNKKKTKNVLRFVYGSEPLKIRSHNETIDIMINLKPGENKMGVTDICPLAVLSGFDLIDSFGFDYLHGVLKGPFEKLINLFFSSENSKQEYYINPEKKKILERRFLCFKGITEIGKIRGIDQIQNLKCHEQRVYFLYLFPTLMIGILPPIYLNHFNLFSKSIYSLLKETITKAELNECEQTLDEFVELFEKLYGKGNVTIYIHMLRHVTSKVRALGPLWSFSTFPFESNGGALKRLVKGGSKVILQITKKYILKQSLLNARNDPEKNIKLLGTKKLIKIEEAYLKAFNSFGDLNVINIFTSIEFKLTRYTSTRHRINSTIDYFLLFKNESIGKSIFFFEHNGTVYAFIETYTILKEYLHIIQIEKSGQYLVKRADEITNKLIYICYKYGINSTREFVCLRPNTIEKT